MLNVYSSSDCANASLVVQTRSWEYLRMEELGTPVNSIPFKHKPFHLQKNTATAQGRRVLLMRYEANWSLVNTWLTCIPTYEFKNRFATSNSKINPLKYTQLEGLVMNEINFTLCGRNSSKTVPSHLFIYIKGFCRGVYYLKKKSHENYSKSTRKFLVSKAYFPCLRCMCKIWCRLLLQLAKCEVKSEQANSSHNPP